MWPKNLIITSIFAVILIVALGFVIKTELAKQDYRQRISAQMQHLQAQQHWLLQRLGQRLVTGIQQHDFNSIVINLRAYEDLAYSFAKQGLGIPVSLHFVSLTAPQTIISGNGKCDATALAPDENYYVRVVDNPQQLQLSRSYTTSEMPGYFMRNFGLGVLDANNNFIGQLDVTFALQSLQHFVMQNVGSNVLFSFELQSQDLQPQISIRNDQYLLAALQFCGTWLVIVASFLICAGLCYHCYKKHRWQQQELRLVNQRYALEHAENTARKHAALVQDKYGILAASPSCETEQLIDLQELIQDMQYVNAELAQSRRVNLDFPLQQFNNLRFTGVPLRLMQILSGIVYEIIKQLPANSTLQLQVLVDNLEVNGFHGSQLTFKFSDNGFYAALEASQTVTSHADVRAKSWGQIQSLVAAEQGILQHTHTAYSGNSISFSIARSLVNNVVQLSEYLS